VTRRAPGWAASFAIRLYALVIRLYPTDFRRTCGDPMLRTFEELCWSARDRTPAAGFLRVVVTELLNATATAWRCRLGNRDPIHLGQDVYYALRRLLSQPAVVLFTILTLGFAIAANTALFSIVDAVLIRPSPFKDAARLVHLVNQSNRGYTFPGMSPVKLKHWRTEKEIFEAVEAYRETTVIVNGGIEPEEVPAAHLSPGLLSTLGVAPVQGRLFTGGDVQAGQDAVAIVSERFWRTRFGADPATIGRSVFINGTPHVIVGVMPNRFHFPSLREHVWLPLDLGASAGNRAANTLVRLTRGLTLESARQRIDAAVARQNAEHPLPGGWGVILDPGNLAGSDEQTERAVLVLFGAVGLVLLTACANVANLLLSRALDRQREFAIRLVLGATRGRIFRELILEGLLLGLAAGAVGTLVARWAVHTLVRLAPESLLYVTTTSIEVDGRVLLFGFSISILTGVLCNLPPALRTLRSRGTDALTGRSRTATVTPFQRRIRAALVIAEVGLAVVLLVGAALMVRSFAKLNAVDIGFNPEQLLAVTVGLDSGRYDTETARMALLERVARDVEGVPGVRGVAVASGVPPSPGSISMAWIESEGGPCATDPDQVVSNRVTPNYFRLLGIPIPSGRALRHDDPPDAVVISQSVARRCGAESLTGKRIRLGPDASWLTVVGTTADVKTRGLNSSEGAFAVYLPFSAGPDVLPNVANMIERRTVSRRLVIQADRPMSIVPEVKRLLWMQDRDQPVLSAAPADELMADTVRRERFVLTLMTLFSGVALALASAGIFGVLAYAVAQRSNEIGIRMALGASSASVLRLVVGHGMVLVTAGVAGGVAVAAVFSRVLAGLLYEVDTHDPLVFVSIPALVFLVALFASWIPTTRALRVDPASALRVE
jgi:putative ABC transport system permease protein